MRKSALALVLFCAPLVASCYSNPSKFNKDIAKRTCDWYFDCYRSAAEAQYSSQSDCEDTVQDDWENNESNCSYNKKEARDCMDWVKDQKDNCSMNLIEAAFELADQCKDVYYDCNAGLEVQDTDGALASFPESPAE